MKNIKEKAAYEVIQTDNETGVVFYTSKDTGSYVPKHWHRALEIIYMIEGKLKIFMENKEYILEAGDCFLINAKAMHATQCDSYNQAILFQIPIDFLKQYIPDIEAKQFLIDGNRKEKSRQYQQFKDTLLQMKMMKEENTQKGILLFNSRLFELLSQLCEYFTVVKPVSGISVSNKDFERLEWVINYTQEHYQEKITIAQIADIACLQPEYFCRFFKKCMGITFLEYQNELRISYIYRDLISTKEPVGRILERYGFNNYKLFRKMFYDKFGTTPAKIRKNISSGYS